MDIKYTSHSECKPTHSAQSSLLTLLEYTHTPTHPHTHTLICVSILVAQCAFSFHIQQSWIRCYGHEQTVINELFGYWFTRNATGRTKTPLRKSTTEEDTWLLGLVGRGMREREGKRTPVTAVSTGSTHNRHTVDMKTGPKGGGRAWMNACVGLHHVQKA